MASEAAKHIVSAKLTQARPFSPECESALNGFYKAARDYQIKVMNAARNLPTYGERRNFLTSKEVQAWDEHIKTQLEVLEKFGIRFSGLMVPDICQAFVAVYLSVKTK